ncbi:MAG: FG-GAP repeat protein [Chthoniobacterales bacterium]
MKSQLHLNSKLLHAAGATAVFLFSVLAPARADMAVAAKPGKTQHLASADAVPKGLARADWTSIRAAYQAHRHQAVRAESGYRAHNPEQQWRMEFDGRGFTTRPEAGAWQWGLELKSFGFPDQKRAISHGAKVSIEGERVTYVRDPGLREWFINDERGLEHGLTVEQRPAGANNSETQLEFDLAVRGNLRPEISADGAKVRFVDPEGSAVVTYAGLKVSDAQGNSLPARFAAQKNGVRLLIEEQGAHYPITVDPIAQQAYLKASNTDAGDLFGTSVAVSGDTVVVGAPGEASNATGVNGDQSNNSALGAGAAYVFVRNGTTWTQQAYLKASNTDPGDTFGISVAISGDTVVVGAYLEASNATGVNGDQTDNHAGLAGAAYVFVRNGTTWTQQAYLKASNTDAGDEFGISVAVSGDTVAIGAFFESSNATGVNGDQADNSAGLAGAAYVFVRNGTTWTQQAYLKASNTDPSDVFGFSVAVSGDTVVVGAENEDSNATGINGDQTNNSEANAGAAYVFVRNGTTWTQQAYLKASNTDASDLFGFSVAVSGDTVVIGTPFESSNATGVNGDQANNSAIFAGAAYVFVRNGTTWSQQAYLKASNTDPHDSFGVSVAVSSDTVVVGAKNEGSNATGINGDEADNSLARPGAAYVFVRSGVTWSQQAYVKASNTEEEDAFGGSVAASGDTVVVGAIGEDSSATGVNGDQTDNTAVDAGASYVFNGFGPGPTPTPAARLLNVSTRLEVGVDENVLIVGFIITGTDPKQVLLRAIGPSIDIPGVTMLLADPFLELHEADGTLVTNDNWRDTQEQEIIDTGLPPSDDHESAILATLDPGAHTAIVRGVGGTTGVALVEAYDLDTSGNSQLANISTRGLVMTGDSCMIAGFIAGPDTDAASSIVIRAIGPTLAGFGIAGPLLDPTLELHNGDGDLIDSNDNWIDGPDAQMIADDGLAPSNDNESALLMTAAPGAYTAIVRGANETTGVALVEVYNLQ